MNLLKQTFDRDGAVFPLKVFEPEEIAVYRDKVMEAQRDLALMKSDYRCKSQVLFPWLDQIVHNEQLGDYVEALIGPNFSCWDTLFWVKEPGDKKFVSWHQDATYWNFFPKDAVTVWLAFNDATEESGAIQYVLGSHKESQHPHFDIKAEGNLLMRGQTVDYNVGQTKLAEVPAGHVTIHSPYMVHGSAENKSSQPRIACGMIFVATHCKPVATYAPETTVMVRGVDEYNYMLHDPRPTGDWARDETAWRRAYDYQHENYYRMSNAV